MDKGKGARGIKVAVRQPDGSTKNYRQPFKGALHFAEPGAEPIRYVPDELSDWKSIPEINAYYDGGDSKEKALRRELAPYRDNRKLCEANTKRGSHSPHRRYNVDHPTIRAAIEKVFPR